MLILRDGGDANTDSGVMIVRFRSAGPIDVTKREAHVLLNSAQAKVFCVEIDKRAQEN